MFCISLSPTDLTFLSDRTNSVMWLLECAPAHHFLDLWTSDLCHPAFSCKGQVWLVLALLGCPDFTELWPCRLGAPFPPSRLPLGVKEQFSGGESQKPYVYLTQCDWCDEVPLCREAFCEKTLKVISCPSLEPCLCGFRSGCLGWPRCAVLGRSTCV